MTSLEAMLNLRSYVAYGSFQTMTDTQREAIDMAMETLSKEETMHATDIVENHGLCPRCGATVFADDVYCRICGQKISFNGVA